VVWVLVDVAIVLVALALLVLAGLSHWRRVKALGRALAVAGTQMAGLTDSLDTLGAAREPATAVTTFTRMPPGGHVSPARERSPGVRSTRSP
jgi:hypothetical protein